jgi:hypothetical protein
MMIDSILHWNDIALSAVKADFSTSTSQDNPSPEQGGPTRTSRALAIIHLAMFDAYFGVKGGSATYLSYNPSEKPGTTDHQAAQAAVAATACLTLITLYPKQSEIFLKAHENFVAMLPDNDPKIEQGLKWGALVAHKLLKSRENDGSEASDKFYAPSTEPGRHRVDPMNPGQGFLGPMWGKVKPFGISDLLNAIVITPLPAMDTQKYADDFNEVYSKGRHQGGTRAPEETTKGLFWAFDGARNIGVPPRLVIVNKNRTLYQAAFL